MRRLLGLALALLAGVSIAPVRARADGASTSSAPSAGLVLVLANRQWEVEPLIRTLAKKTGRPSAIEGMELIYHSSNAMGASARRPRCRFRCDGYAVEVWCIEDLTSAAPTSAKLSLAKWDVLPVAFAGEGASPKKPRKPSVVISFGSGAGDPNVACNGSVVVGSDVFVHDPSIYSKDPWYGDLDGLVSGSSTKLLAKIDSVRKHVEPDFAKPPVTAGTPRLLSGGDLVALSDVDVAHSNDYAWADPATVHGFRKKVEQGRVGSVDTTQGLVRLRTRDLCDAPFVYVSGILNRIGKFSEIDKAPHVQCTTVMTNAAETTLWLIPELTSSLATK